MIICYISVYIRDIVSQGRRFGDEENRLNNSWSGTEMEFGGPLDRSNFSIRFCFNVMPNEKLMQPSRCIPFMSFSLVARVLKLSTPCLLEGPIYSMVKTWIGVVWPQNLAQLGKWFDLMKGFQNVMGELRIGAGIESWDSMGVYAVSAVMSVWISGTQVEVKTIRWIGMEWCR